MRIIKKEGNHKQELNKFWKRLEPGIDYKKFEEFACKLVSFITDDRIVLIFQNFINEESEIDSIILNKNHQFKSDIFIESKDTKKSKTSHIDQLNSNIDRHKSANIGFLVTRSRLSRNQLTRIKSLNDNSEIKILIPIQGPHIEEFFTNDESIQDFLKRMINYTLYDIYKLEITLSR